MGELKPVTGASPPHEERHRFCPGCGAEAAAPTSFCGGCGHSLAKAPTGHPGSEVVPLAYEGASSIPTNDAEPFPADVAISHSTPGHQLLSDSSILIPFAPDTALLRLEQVLRRSGTVTIDSRVPFAKLSGNWQDQTNVFSYEATLRAASGGTGVNFISASKHFPGSLERSLLQEFSTRLTRNESSESLGRSGWSQHSSPSLSQPINAVDSPLSSSEDVVPRRRRWIVPVVLIVLGAMAAGAFVGMSHLRHPAGQTPADSSAQTLAGLEARCIAAPFGHTHGQWTTVSEPANGWASWQTPYVCWRAVHVPAYGGGVFGQADPVISVSAGYAFQSPLNTANG